MKSTLALFSLMAASAMASDPCNNAGGEKACGIMNACMWVEKPSGHSSKNHQDHHNLNRGCHMIGVTDRDSIKGRSRHGAANPSEVDALVEMGFHTTIEEMACEEAFTKRDCRVLSKRGVSCNYECTNLDDFSGSCVPAGDTPENEQFKTCMLPVPPPPAPRVFSLKAFSDDKCTTPDLETYRDSGNIYKYMDPVFEECDDDGETIVWAGGIHTYCGDAGDGKISHRYSKIAPKTCDHANDVTAIPDDSGEFGQHYNNFKTLETYGSMPLYVTSGTNDPCYSFSNVYAQWYIDDKPVGEEEMDASCSTAHFSGARLWSDTKSTNPGKSIATGPNYQQF